jgi:hypothetical protein
VDGEKKESTPVLSAARASDTNHPKDLATETAAGTSSVRDVDVSVAGWLPEQGQGLRTAVWTDNGLHVKALAGAGSIPHTH